MIAERIELRLNSRNEKSEGNKFHSDSLLVGKLKLSGQSDSNLSHMPFKYTLSAPKLQDKSYFKSSLKNFSAVFGGVFLGIEFFKEAVFQRKSLFFIFPIQRRPLHQVSLVSHPKKLDLIHSELVLDALATIVVVLIGLGIFTDLLDVRIPLRPGVCLIVAPHIVIVMFWIIFSPAVSRLPNRIFISQVPAMTIFHGEIIPQKEARHVSV